jgi:hypothetical protein
MNVIFSDNVCILFLSCSVKKPKTTARLSKKKQKQASFSSFLMVSSMKSALVVLPFLIVAQNESGIRNIQ